jgi:hypothetical protein
LSTEAATLLQLLGQFRLPQAGGQAQGYSRAA